MPARVITIPVPKGGSGKTTSVQTLALAFSEQGKRGLCIDTDPQGNLSSVLGYRHKRNAYTLYTVLREFAFNRRRVLPSELGKRVLCIDTDPQGNLSSVLGYRHKRNAYTLYTVLREFAFNRRRVLPSAIYH